jgi:hypothetical protein
MQITELQVTHTVDRFGKALVQVESSIGNGMEAYPDQLRALAAALCKAADDADSRTASNLKRFPTSPGEYPL